MIRINWRRLIVVTSPIWMLWLAVFIGTEVDLEGGYQFAMVMTLGILWFVSIITVINEYVNIDEPLYKIVGKK